MSRYDVPSKNLEYNEAVVGWDNGLATFFASLYDTKSQPEERTLFLVGADPTVPPVTSVKELCKLVETHIDIPEGIRERLENDYRNRTQPTAHQQRVQKFLLKTSGEISDV